jgi:hypothetical protein
LAPLTGSAQEPQQQPTNPTAPPPPPQLPPRDQDYPDKQGLTIGAFYWLAIRGQQPDLKTGDNSAGQFEDILNIGKPGHSAGLYISYPITRTGTLKLEGFQMKGAGSQILPADSQPFSVQYNKGDIISSNYRVRGVKFWLDDLFWPHQYPVARFRLKAMYGLQYLQTRVNLDAPYKPTTSTFTTWTTSGTKQSFLPALGMAAEYAVAPHVLFRASASGFYIPGHSYYYDGDAGISVRRNHVEVLFGFKALGYRSSPNDENFVKNLIAGGYAGLRWHF